MGEELMRHTRFVVGLFAVLVAFAAVAAVTIAPARAAGICATYVSDTRTSSSVTVTFDVNSAGCVVSLVSYQSLSTGHQNEQYATGTFGVGTHTLTVPVTCGTD